MAKPTRPGRSHALHLLAVLAVMLSFNRPVVAQTGECVLVPDDQNPSEKILHCGDYLLIRTVPGTRYRLENPAPRTPEAARLDAGALMIEFHGSAGRQNFQILTPQAIASVRGTKWIIEAAGDQTSTFVMAGAVSVVRRNGGRTANLGPGEGADVDAGSGPIVVKRWPAVRVRTLLARFGQ
jgi:FecR protein